MRDCAESVVELIGPVAARKGIEVVCEIAPGTPTIAVGDGSRLRQILLNLLNNAVKFTETGEIVLSAWSEEPEQAGTQRYHFTVRDTGIGISAEGMQRLFRSFSQADASTSRRYGGTGLGLAISKRLAELMGGTMWVESAGVAGEGSTFHATLVAGEADQAPARVDTHLLEGRGVLIVDDNATNRRILAAQVAQWGMMTEVAASADEGLEAMAGDHVRRRGLRHAHAADRRPGPGRADPGAMARDPVRYRVLAPPTRSDR